MKSHLPVITITAAVAVCMPPTADSFVVRPIPRDLRRPRCLRLPAADRAGDATSAETDADATTAPGPAPRAKGHVVEVSHEGRTASVFVQPHETILMALERNRSTLSMSSLPFDCQRGNCLTCSGLVKEGSSSIVLGDDGLAPAVGDNLRKKGFVLTCSSYVVGEGAKIELGQNDAAWTETYQTQPESGMPDMGNAAAAKALRLAAEKDVPKWARDTEKTLKKS